MRYLITAFALLCLSAPSPVPAADQSEVQTPHVASLGIRLSIERHDRGIDISGNSSSLAHPTIMREAIRQVLGDASGQAIVIDMQSGPLTPAGWSLITEMVLRAVLTTRQSTAIVTPSSIAVQGITADSAAWDVAVLGIEAARLDDMDVQLDMIPADDERSYHELCLSQFQDLTDGARIDFANSAAEINGDAFRTLDALVDLAISCPSLKFELIGHTDSSGDPSANLQISEARAQSVESYLLARGLPRSRVQSRAAGSAEPLVGTADRRSRRRNRRVEIRLLNP